MLRDRARVLGSVEARSKAIDNGSAGRAWATSSRPRALDSTAAAQEVANRTSAMMDITAHAVLAQPLHKRILGCALSGWNDTSSTARSAWTVAIAFATRAGSACDAADDA